MSLTHRTDIGRIDSGSLNVGHDNLYYDITVVLFSSFFSVFAFLEFQRVTISFLVFSLTRLV